MKIGRLIGILSVLLQRDKVTSQELAEKFEVSRWTILRDIESINIAGIPIVSDQGQGGGISIMDGYKIDRTLLSSGDMQAILSGLRSLDSVGGTNRYRQLMEKLSADDMTSVNVDNHIIIALIDAITIDECVRGKQECDIHIYYKFIDKGYSGKTE